MKNQTSSTTHTQKHTGEIARARRMLRRDLSMPTPEKLPDLQSAKNMAEQLEILEKYIAKVPEVDYQLRNSIRNAIVNGDYTIDPHSIADKFLKFEKDIYS